MADNTPPKHRLTPELEANKWKPGQSGNPAGRPKGSRSVFSEAFLKDFIAEWEAGGKQALTQVRSEDPATFLRVAASILPKEFNLNEGESSLERLLEQYSIPELDLLITGLCALGDSKAGAEAEAKERPDKQPGSVH